MNSLVPSGKSRLLILMLHKSFFPFKNLLAVLALKRLNDTPFLVSKPMTIVNIILVKGYPYSFKYLGDFFFKVLLGYSNFQQFLNLLPNSIGHFPSTVALYQLNFSLKVC